MKDEGEGLGEGKDPLTAMQVCHLWKGREKKGLGMSLRPQHSSEEVSVSPVLSPWAKCAC